jgi:hypothetical protein
MKLTKADKVAMVRGLPASHKAILRKHMMGNGAMSGAGFLDFLKKIPSSLGSIVKAVGPTILKEVLVPLAKSKLGLGMKKGKGLKPSGGGLRLAGDRSSRTKKLRY